MRSYKSFIILVCMSLACGSDSSDGSFTLGDGEGFQSVSGSLASFAVNNDYLYALTNGGLEVFHLSPEGRPSLVSSVEVADDAETVFIYNDYLLFGSSTGMIIMDINSPANPTYVARVSHQTACDPVIARDDVAYLTIRNGSNCTQISQNLLIVYEISEINNPKEIRRINMIDPRGLGIVGDKLLVGEGRIGLKQFDISRADSPVFEIIYPDFEANDVIGLNNSVFILGSRSIEQLEMKDDTLVKISTIK